MPPDAPAPSAPVYLHSNLESVLDRISHSEWLESPIHRTFVIGGASLYRDTLALSPSSGAFVDRILLTRVLSPAFEECDVYMPDFQNTGDEQTWRRASHKVLQEWAGMEVPQGVQEENGIKYEFQMWVR